MESSDTGRQPPSCMATLLYCDRGACGPDGACCSSTFLSVSSTPPEVGGAIGVGLPGCDCVAGALPRIEDGLRSTPASPASAILVTKKNPARIAVVRDKILAVPRLDMKPAPPPMPRPPPSDFCSSTAPITTETIMR